MTTVVQTGNVVTATVTFAPDSGTVALDDVTCRLSKAGGVEVDLTASVGEDATNVFSVDVEIAESDPSGVWQFRWESNSPSPRITLEDATTRFVVHRSKLRTP